MSHAAPVSLTAHQAALFQKAQRALATARLNLADGDTNAAVSRAYFATFYAARAALLDKGEAPDTHLAVHQRFYLHFVVPGRIAPPTGSILPRAAEDRLRAD